MIKNGYKTINLKTDITKIAESQKSKFFTLISDEESAKLLTDNVGIIIYPFKMEITYPVKDEKEYADRKEEFYLILDDMIIRKDNFQEFLGFNQRPTFDKDDAKKIAVGKIEFNFGQR
jgi:hypothetical protein